MGHRVLASLRSAVEDVAPRTASRAAMSGHDARTQRHGPLRKAMEGFDRVRRYFGLCGVLVALLAGTATADTLRGSAMLRERIALPDGLTFEAVIEDISRADAPAERLAATRFETSGQPPFAFEIPYDPAAIQPRARYALRATLHQGGRLFATTDTVHPVLTEGTAEPVEVVMRLVPTGEGRPLPAHGLALPASFTGTLPCADCAGVRHHLDLWPDQVYHLSREWLGRSDGPMRRDELGRWFADPGRGAIVLYGASEMPLFWQVMAPDRLRQMDPAGAPIVSDLDYDLVSDGRFAPTDLERLFVVGEVLIGPDGPGMRECLTGRVLAIETGGDHSALAAAVEAARDAPDTPVVVNVEARIAQPPPGLAPQIPRLTVLQFNAAHPGTACTDRHPVADLVNTYWRIDTLLGEPVPRPPNVREAHLILRGDPTGYVATVGCNRLAGSYDLAGEALTLSPGATTLMACPPPLDAAENRLRTVLEATRGARQSGQRLELLDGEGGSLATLEAVYLR